MEKKISVQQKFTRAFMRKHRGCYKIKQLNQCSFMKAPGPVTLKAILTSEIPLKDKFWFVTRVLLIFSEVQQVTVGVTEIVLPIFEKAHPEDRRIRWCLGALKRYLAYEITEAYNAPRGPINDAINAATVASVAAYHGGTGAKRAACLAACAISTAYNAPRGAINDAINAAELYPGQKYTEQLFEYLKSVCLP
jgi:hypothetical protein